MRRLDNWISFVTLMNMYEAFVINKVDYNILLCDTFDHTTLIILQLYSCFKLDILLLRSYYSILAGMWLHSVPSWIQKMTHKPSLSGMFWLARKREVSIVRAPLIGQSSSKFIWPFLSKFGWNYLNLY